MAKIIVAGDAAVVTSALKLEDIKTVKKYRPEGLKLMGGKDGEEELFMIDSACPSEAGSINKYGAVFNGESPDGQGFATLTVSILERPKDKDVKDYIADKLGGAMIKLNQLEEQIPAILGEIAVQQEQVLSGISVLA